MSITTATPLHEVTGWDLHFRDSVSDKFYRVYISDGTLILHWGRSGSAGQTKIEKYTPDEAKIIAMRQVYAKAGKGYKIVSDEVGFAADNLALQRPDRLYRAMSQVVEQEQFQKQQFMVTTHYDKFIEQTNQVLDAAAKGADFDSLLDQWQNLSGAWAELKDKHDHAAAAVHMVQQVVSQKMMSQ